MGVPWTKKYTPAGVGDVIAQSSQMKLLKTFVQNYKEQKKKAILIHGPSGCGKTSSVYALGKEMNLEIVEMNASDFRNKQQIQDIVGAASQQRSLFGGSKLILVDEMDGLAGRQDYGGIPALVKVIQNSKFPIVITANNPYSSKFSSIRNKSELLQFKELESEDVFEILKNICEKENINYNEDALKTIARRAGGDARGAVNDLEIIATVGEITKDAVNELSERNKTESILSGLMKVFKSKDPKIALTAFDNVEEDFDHRFFWLDENLPKEYTNPADLARAYEHLSKADVFKGRIRRWQHWRFLVFVNQLMTAGVAVSKDKKNKNFIQYKPTGRILKMWWAKQKSMKKKAIAQKIAEKTHTSTKQILKNIDFFRTMFQNDKEMSDKIADELNLGKEEVDWLKK